MSHIFNTNDIRYRHLNGSPCDILYSASINMLAGPLYYIELPDGLRIKAFRYELDIATK